MAFMFENLEVYQKAIDFPELTTSITEQFPRSYHFLTGELNRASLSISTNIAEGNGRVTKADRKNFFIIAPGSVQECVPLLELTRRKGLVNEGTYNRFRVELETVAKMISGLIKGIDKRIK